MTSCRSVRSRGTYLCIDAKHDALHKMSSSFCLQLMPVLHFTSCCTSAASQHLSLLHKGYSAVCYPVHTIFCRLGYERELVGVLEGLVRDMDRKIERQQERAVKESAPKPISDADRAKLDDMLARQKGRG